MVSATTPKNRYGLRHHALETVVPELARHALGAAALVVPHQHSSNDPAPSKADVEMTALLRDALKTIDVDLHGHIVVTSGAAFSFREKGLLQPANPRFGALELTGIMPILSD
ncbi:MAG: hypothetical protein OXF79_19150 [Chloroflexi bacterium]|nr:hypothetical protein [Chloroflexota bacterium]